MFKNEKYSLYYIELLFQNSKRWTKFLSSASLKNTYQKVIIIKKYFYFLNFVGQVQDLKLRFVGDESKEIVVTLVNGRQFIVYTNWRKFHKEKV